MDNPYSDYLVTQRHLPPPTSCTHDLRCGCLPGTPNHLHRPSRSLWPHRLKQEESVYIFSGATSSLSMTNCNLIHHNVSYRVKTVALSVPRRCFLCLSTPLLWRLETASTSSC